MPQTPGSILSQAQQSLTLAQRAMYDRLRAAGVADAVARQLAIAVAKHDVAKMSPLPNEMQVDEPAKAPKKKKRPKASGMRVKKSIQTRIVKTDERPQDTQWKRLVTSVVYEPNTYDTDGDFMDAETIEKACHGFMRKGGFVNIEHAGGPVRAEVVENWTAPCQITFDDGSDPDLTIKKGTWVQTFAVDDRGLWKGCLDGTYNGFSLEGSALREEGYIP